MSAPPQLPVFRLPRTRRMPFIPVTRLHLSPQPQPLLRRALQRVLALRPRDPMPGPR